MQSKERDDLVLLCLLNALPDEVFDFLVLVSVTSISSSFSITIYRVTKTRDRVMWKRDYYFSDTEYFFGNWTFYRSVTLYISTSVSDHKSQFCLAFPCSALQCTE